jgi:hypothetical protein
MRVRFELGVLSDAQRGRRQQRMTVARNAKHEPPANFDAIFPNQNER